MWQTLTISTLEQGLIYAPMVLGVYLTFRVLNYADLSVDGSLPLGAAIAAHLIAGGANPWYASLLALVGGAVAGTATGLLHTRLKIAPLLSGILTMTALYSVNLRIMGKANVPLIRVPTVFTHFGELGLSTQIAVIILSAITVAIFLGCIYWFLQTEIGLTVRATGDNERMIIAQGVNTETTKIIALGMSNALVAFSGAYVAQSQGFADVGMGIGSIVAGLASVIMGEALFGRSTILRSLLAVVGGSIAYRLILGLVLWFGLTPTDLKLMTAIIVVLALAWPSFRSRGYGQS